MMFVYIDDEFKLYISDSLDTGYLLALTTAWKATEYSPVFLRIR